MPENEFEKKISSEMQELKFKPSENVWLRVEERIKKKKERRIFVVIFLLAGLALLGYWQRGNLFGEQKNDIAKTTQKDSAGDEQKEDNSQSANEINNSSEIKQNTETTKSEETKNTTGKTADNKLIDDRSVVDKKDIAVSKNESNRPKKNNEETNGKPESVKNKKNNKPEASIAIISANSKKKKGLDNDQSKDLKTNSEMTTKQGEVNQTEVKPVESKIDSTKAVTGEQEKDTATKKDTLLKADPTKDPAPQVIKKDPSAKKWKWGLHITPGISSLNDNDISFGRGNFADAFAYQNPSGSGTGAQPPPRQKPSEIKAGFAFQVGGFAQRQLSSRTNLSMGLQYGYYSNALHIGNIRSSGNNQFFSVSGRNANQVYNAGSDTTKYTNSYHFIELPFLFQWQLNKNKAKPFIWNIGFTVGQLISSNAIMYDTAFNGVYYKNKSQLNKTQFSLSTGFSWTIANNKQVRWNLGPVADLHLSKLIDNPFENKRFLFFVGLRTGIVFNSKK
jgi:hypothetical protein